MGKFLIGIAGSVIAGVILYFFTSYMSQFQSSPTYGSSSSAEEDLFPEEEDLFKKDCNPGPDRFVFECD